jgi:DNA-binding IclR family transcriptional regulator
MADVKPEESGVAAVDRSIEILKAVTRFGRSVSLAEIARETGFYKSTILRLLKSLERAALVMHKANGKYTLGPYAKELGRAYENQYHLSEFIFPVLEGLVAQNTESASFHVFCNPQERMCLLRVDSAHPTLDRIRVGDLLPLDRGAAGKLLTAYLVNKISTKEFGVIAISMGERDPVCAAVASPVFDSDGEVLGVISLSGPKERFTPAAIKKMSNLVQAASAQVTTMIGGKWPKN